MLKTYGRVLTSVSSLNQLFPKSLNLSIFRPYCLALHILKSTLSCSLTQLHLSNATSLSAPVSTTPVSTEILLHYYHSSVFLLTSQSKLCGRRRKCGPNKTFPKTFVMQPEKKKKKSTRASCFMNSVSVRLCQTKAEIQYVFILEILKAFLKLMQYLHFSMIEVVEIMEFCIQR